MASTEADKGMPTELVRRLRNKHQDMLDYRQAMQFDPADWEPDDNLYEEAANEIEALNMQIDRLYEDMAGESL